MRRKHYHEKEITILTPASSPNKMKRHIGETITSLNDALDSLFKSVTDYHASTPAEARIVLRALNNARDRANSTFDKAILVMSKALARLEIEHG